MRAQALNEVAGRAIILAPSPDEQPMRILIISDIHGNSVALDAVLAHAGRYDAVW